MTRLEEAATRRLAAIGQRVTPARWGIVQVLGAASSPLTVPEICRADPSLAQSSVYRSLVVLEEAGIVHRIDVAGHSRFELAEDLSEHHHHHLICTECGRVEDFVPTASLERQAVDALARAARRQGFEVRGHRLDVVGRCAACVGS